MELQNSEVGIKFGQFHNVNGIHPIKEGETKIIGDGLTEIECFCNADDDDCPNCFGAGVTLDLYLG